MRFDIIAQANGPLKVDPDGFPGPAFRMIRALIEDRFQVRVRDEMRERPVYALVVANTNGALGPRLQKSTVDCGARDVGTSQRCAPRAAARRPRAVRA